MKVRLFVAMALLVGVMSVVACGKKEEAPAVAPAAPVVEAPAPTAPVVAPTPAQTAVPAPATK